VPDISSSISAIISYLKSLFSEFMNLLHSGYNSIIQYLSSIHLSFNTTGIANTITSWLNNVNLHYNFLFLDLFPSYAVKYLAPASLLIAGYLSEKHYVGRATVFTNTIALNVFIYYFLQDNSLLLSTVYLATSIILLYANFGFILGFVALVSYKRGKGETKLFKSIVWAYSSVVVGILIVFLSLLH